MKSVWEYKTILVPDMDSWLNHHHRLASTAAYGRKSASWWLFFQPWEVWNLYDVEVNQKKACDEIISKHTTFLNEQIGILGKDGWELVSIWKSDPGALFKNTIHWMTIARFINRTRNPCLSMYTSSAKLDQCPPQVFVILKFFDKFWLVFMMFQHIFD